MSKVYFTLPLGPLNMIDGRVWEKLDNGWYLSPDLSEEEAKAYLGCRGYRAVSIPAEPAPIPAQKKPAAKKTTAKSKGGA
ncbi:hypothetical protein MF451_003807 [Salmonella enterica subsp. enterica serovar Saintpaul]|nr:hypothetical protein [Salmonella enterica subsp. enterica serovar Saintpaul]